MFLSVLINSWIHTVCHIPPWDCQHKTSKHLVMASNYMKTEPMTCEGKKKKSARTMVYIFLHKTLHFWFKTLHSTVPIKKKIMAVFFPWSLRKRAHFTEVRVLSCHFTNTIFTKRDRSMSEAAYAS
jgi:hypothetical protein